MRYFLDTEFNEFGGDLISLALVRDDTQQHLYLATECPNPGPWVKEHVIPVIDVGEPPTLLRPHEFGIFIAVFLSRDPRPVIVADWPDDIAYFCRALVTGPGKTVGPRRLGFEMIRGTEVYPTTLEGAVQHNALWDARALRHALSDP